MIECWLTVQVDLQRTMDVRVSGESYADVAEQYKEKDGLKVNHRLKPSFLAAAKASE